MSTVFADRVEAAGRLAATLAGYRGKNPLILAIPRGAVQMGRVIADQLNGELDVVLVRKLRSPFSPEFAVGAIDETGWAYIAPHAREAGATDKYLKQEQHAQLEILKMRRTLYTPERLPTDAAGRIAIVVDDGLATGATMIAALHAVRARAPAKLVCAVPVARARQPRVDPVLRGRRGMPRGAFGLLRGGTVLSVVSAGRGRGSRGAARR